MFSLNSGLLDLKPSVTSKLATELCSLFYSWFGTFRAGLTHSGVFGPVRPWAAALSVLSLSEEQRSSLVYSIYTRERASSWSVWDMRALADVQLVEGWFGSGTWRDCWRSMNSPRFPTLSLKTTSSVSWLQSSFLCCIRLCSQFGCDVIQETFDFVVFCNRQEQFTHFFCFYNNDTTLEIATVKSKKQPTYWKINKWKRKLRWSFLPTFPMTKFKK